MNDALLIGAFRRALASFPANKDDATALLVARGFNASCTEVKHGASHTVYHVRMVTHDFVLKVTKES